MKIIKERVAHFKLQPHSKDTPSGTRLIVYAKTDTMDGAPMQSVKSVPIPHECWGRFKDNPILHYIELKIKGQVRRLPLAIGGALLPDKWLPKGLTWLGRARVIAYWLLQRFLGNV